MAKQCQIVKQDWAEGRMKLTLRFDQPIGTGMKRYSLVQRLRFIKGVAGMPELGEDALAIQVDGLDDWATVLPVILQAIAEVWGFEPIALPRIQEWYCPQRHRHSTLKGESCMSCGTFFPDGEARHRLEEIVARISQRPHKAK